MHGGEQLAQRESCLGQSCHAGLRTGVAFEQVALQYFQFQVIGHPVLGIKLAVNVHKHIIRAELQTGVRCKAKSINNAL